MRRVRPWLIAGTATVLAGFLLRGQIALLLRDVKGVTITPIWFAVGVCTYALFVFLRGMRLTLLAGTAGSTARPFFLGALYTAGCSFLPGGLGELVVPIWYRRETGFSGPFTAAVIVARLQDILSWLAIILALGLGTTLFGRERILLLVVAVGVILLTVALWSGVVRRGLIQRLQAWPWLHRRTGSFVSEVDRSLSHSWGIHSAWLLTVALRLMSIATYYAMLRAVGVLVSPAALGVAGGIVAVLLILPIQGIAGLGTEELWWTLMLRSLGVRFSLILPSALALHVPLLLLSAVFFSLALTWSTMRRGE